MFFLWTITKRGRIWLDGDAFKQLVAKRLPADFHCQEVSFVGDQNLLNIYIALPEKDDPQKRLALIDKFEDFFKPMGISIHIHWTRRAPEDISSQAIWKRPLFWAAAAGGIAGIANLGLKGMLWVAASTIIGYIVSWIVLSEDGNRMVGKLINDIKDLRR